MQQNIAKIYREHLRGKLNQWKKKLGRVRISFKTLINGNPFPKFRINGEVGKQGQGDCGRPLHFSSQW